jgi:hypothetical protein
MISSMPDSFARGRQIQRQGHSAQTKTGLIWCTVPSSAPLILAPMPAFAGMAFAAL